MLALLKTLKVSPLLTASIIDILINSEYHKDGKITLTDDQLYELVLPHNLTPSTVIRLLSGNKFAVTNIHTRTKSGNSDGHHYYIDLNTRQDKPLILKISKNKFPIISKHVLSSTEGALV